MSDIPRSPAGFFEEYAPAQLARLGSALQGKSSPGAVAFEVTGAGAWSLRLAGGVVEVSSGVAADALVRITLGSEDFETVIVGGAERFADDTGIERQLVAVRVLTVDVERARLLKESPGSLGLRLSFASREHRLTLTLGGVEPKVETPDAEIACALEDLWAIQGGTANPFELLMNGKIRISGNMQLAMALGAALGT